VRGEVLAHSSCIAVTRTFITDVETKLGEASSETVREEVRRRYGATSRGDVSSCGEGCCTSTSADTLGYSAEETAAAPEASNLGLGCGNPLAIASLREGQVVLDLGSGAGFDCFLAARAVGPSGKVIGVDMTHEMLSKARENAEKNGFTIVPDAIFINFCGFSFAEVAGHLLGAARSALMSLNRMLEGCFAEIRLRKRAPDLNFRYVRHVLGYRDLAVHLVAFDRQFLKQVNVSI